MNTRAPLSSSRWPSLPAVLLALLVTAGCGSTLAGSTSTDAPTVETGAAIPERGPALGPLRRHPSNPRYFTDGAGKVVYLSGSYPQWNLQDVGTGDPPPHFDYTAYLNLLTRQNHNFIRMWVWENAIDTAGERALPMPYVRSGPGAALDGKPRFDLHRFEETYFDRLRGRVISARDRGIYVSIMLFQGWSLFKNSANRTLRNPWIGHPFHRANNINGIDGDSNRDNEGLEVHTLQIPAIIALQEAYVRKVVDTVNDLDNVLFEIANESHAASTEWQYHLINQVHGYEVGKPKRHPVGMTFQWSPRGSGTNAALFNSPADWISLGLPDAGHVPIADGRKVVVLDDDHRAGWADRGWIWKSFTRGNNTISLDPIDRDRWRRTKGSFRSVRSALGHIRAYADRVNLVMMTPRGDLVSTGYCLAAPGSEYLVYQPDSGRFTMDLAPGTYTYEWFSPEAGIVADADSLTTSGGKRSFTPPFAGDAVLYLKAGTQ